MNYCLCFLLILGAVPGFRAQRQYPCGARPCSPQFDPVCGGKSSEGGKVIYKMFANVCKMEEGNDCDESGSNPWILYNSCPSELVMNRKSLKAKYQEENEEDEEDFKKFVDDLQDL